MVAKVSACAVAKLSSQKVKDKWRALKEAALNYPHQLDTHILKTATGEVHVANLVKCNYNFQQWCKGTSPVADRIVSLDVAYGRIVLSS